MGGHIVVSFSRADAGVLVDELARHLRAGLPSYSLVRGGRPADAEPGPGPDIDDAIRTCRAFLLVVTPGVRTGSPSVQELGLATMFGRPVIALLVDRSARVPAGIPSRQVVDISADPSGNAEAAVREIADRLAVLDHPRLLAVGAAPMTPPDALRGRDAELAELVGHVRSTDVRLVTVIGPSGIGKTALACHLLRGWPGPERLGVVHLGPPSELPLGYPRLFRGLCRLLPDDAAARLAGRHRNPQETPTAMIRAVLEALPPEPVVVLIDGAERLLGEAGGTLDAALAEALRALVSAPAHRVTIVATSRVPPGGLLGRDPGAQRRIDLAELSVPDAIAVLRDHDPHGELGLRDAAPGELARAGGNPRALELLAAVLADGKDSLPDLLDQAHRGAVAQHAEGAFDRIGVPEPLDERGDAVDVLSDLAFAHLVLLDRHVVAALAAFPVPVPAAAVDHVLRHYHDYPDSEPVLARLHERGLLLRVDGRYALRPADRERALDGVPVGYPSDVDADPLPVSRNAMWQLAADLLAAVSTPYEQWSSIDDLAPQLAEFELHWANGAVDEAALLLMRGAVAELRSWGHHRLTASLLDRLRERIGEQWINAWCVSALGSAFAGLGQPNRAAELHERAAVIYSRMSDTAGEAEELSHLGHCHADLGDLPRALRLHERALTLHSETGNRLAAAAARVDLAWCHTELGRPDEATRLLHQALDVQDALGDTWSQIDTLATLGRTLATAGDHADAVGLLERGLELSREAGDQWAEARHSRLLGACRLDTGRIDDAVALHQRALDISRAVGDREDEAVALGDLAVGRLLLDDPADALDLAERAFAIAAEIGDLRLRAACLDLLGDCHLALGRTAEAADDHQQAIEVADAAGFGQVQTQARIHLARLHLAAGEVLAAAKVGAGAARHPYPPAQPEVSLLTGAVQMHLGQTDAARQYFRAAISLADDRLRRSPDAPEFGVLDVRALAHAALAALGDPGHTAEAATDFRAARALTSAGGAVAAVLRWLDALAPHGGLDHLRGAASGREHSQVS
ncbi:tetratricopeptide repeat protein [Pseudonocardia humida]|uniref:Tetratricopeptide repeat protein n=1 Tax=Pseudonocardia humida TaxID=2800819 RepID=A0ABT1A5M1_9PSEU|nr:tetratricopeptide repeat protein [Pseudonocardia humida]MCO1658271.1 tetratricopeptide repeat protein [Pseudonocardia humida]